MKEKSCSFIDTAFYSAFYSILGLLVNVQRPFPSYLFLGVHRREREWKTQRGIVTGQTVECWSSCCVLWNIQGSTNDIPCYSLSRTFQIILWRQLFGFL